LHLEGAQQMLVERIYVQHTAKVLQTRSLSCLLVGGPNVFGKNCVHMMAAAQRGLLEDQLVERNSDPAWPGRISTTAACSSCWNSRRLIPCMKCKRQTEKSCFGAQCLRL
jgi:hypothetical protein